MYRKYILEFPKELTNEEKELKSKYAILRQLKEKLSLFHKQEVPKDSSELPITEDRPKKCPQDDLKKTALQILKTSGNLKKTSYVGKSTKEFKKAFRQSGEINGGQNSCAKGDYAPQSEPQPRSVIVRGQNLTSELLHKAFDSAGDIWKMRLDHEKQSAVITFKKSANARIAANNVNNSVIDGGQLGVKLMKTRNTVWSEISAADAKFDKYLKSREKRTIHVSYKGSLTMQDFRTIFRGIGKIEKIYLSSRNPASSSKKRFAFLTFEFEEDARRALDEKDGEVFKGVRLRITPQKTLFSDSAIPVTASQEKDSREIITFDEQLF
ncbi:hypothetical protein AVEN_172600-1 [Araneus ventricosus]|uniref:Negative elongation factor E n=1 Tax=Araneus ventricosus TaxID=182803 RepID=A0A4Y2SYU5_ARAVE|nr:hypothetical protein AVEN_172600-1 [Araneus ventricosus]